ncbi:ribonucleases P/MRP protein subunit POP1-domain-containing protein [Pestalotiopsis sp. NC0098]|nr:ribonucleases P/MRP protein subunit POP1-domain-containing protein [Pestalotiopsis sp. NC0098]
MAPQQGHQPGDKQKKRPAEASLTSASAKKSKTDANGRHNGSTAAGNSQKSGRGNNNGQQNGHSNQRDARRPAPSYKDVRVIAAQPADAALKDGELDIQAFLNARGFEIKALDESMRRTQVSKTSRAFQKVPFTMRRRAAAHNHKRVPKRLYRRAKREMELDNTPTVNSKTRKPKSNRARLRAETALRLGKLADRKRRQKLNKKEKDGKLDPVTVQTRLARPKIKRNALNEPPVTARKFRKRQLNKTWLPTHLWHAKRATMTPPKDPLWRFAIPLTPTQKCYRPTHRALREKGAIAWDMSYMSTIGLSGAERSVTQVLKALGLTAESLWNESGEKWRSGAIHWNGTLTRNKDNSPRVIGPATIIWNPQVQEEDVEMTSEGASENKVVRQVFIRLHPSTFLETFNETLRLAKRLTPRPHVEDLRYEIGSIEVTGPDSTEALLGVLSAYPSKPNLQDSHATKWETLLGVSPSVLPAGSLLAFSAMDPRLRYPPRCVRPPTSARESQHTSKAWHQDVTPGPIALFDRDARFKASQLPSQKALNRRKGKNAPGSFLKPTQLDPEIPVILLASRQADMPGRWTLLMPWKCVLPTWYALMHYPLSSGGNPLLGGLHEMQQSFFEQGLPWFPGDFPATDAGRAWELEQRQTRKKAWDRMPKGKRVNYETLDLGAGRKGEVGQGWACNFESLFDLGAGNTAAENADVDMADQDGESLEAAKAHETNPATPSQHALTQLTQVSKVGLNAVLSGKAEALPPNALVAVKIKVQGRGVPGPCARVYRLPNSKPAIVATQAEVPATHPLVSKTNGLPSDLAEKWLATKPQKGKQARATPKVKHNSAANLDLEQRKRLLAQELTTPPDSDGEGINGHLPCPNAEDLVGFITTGSFSLREGQAEAIASLSAEKALEELKRYKNKSDPSSRLVVVRNAGQSVGWLARWELV